MYIGANYLVKGSYSKCTDKNLNGVIVFITHRKQNITCNGKNVGIHPR